MGFDLHLAFSRRGYDLLARMGIIIVLGRLVHGSHEVHAIVMRLGEVVLWNSRPAMMSARRSEPRPDDGEATPAPEDRIIRITADLSK